MILGGWKKRCGLAVAQGVQTSFDTGNNKPLYKALQAYIDGPNYVTDPIVFAVDDVWLTARRIDGQFPNYRQLLPETFEAEVELPREELLDVVRRTGLMAQRKSPLRLRFEEGQLTISAQTQDVGEAHESLPAAYTADPIEIGFNAEFLRDGLESLEDDQVRLRLISPLRPGLIQGAGDDFLYLIMPIRLAG